MFDDDYVEGKEEQWKTQLLGLKQKQSAQWAH